MKKKTLLKILAILVFALVIVLLAIYFLTNDKEKAISKEKLQEIEEHLSNTIFLNCVYNTPEEIKPYYIFAASSDKEKKAEEDNVEYLYLSLLRNDTSTLENIYPEIIGSKSLSEKEKYIKIRKELANDAKGMTFYYQKLTYNSIKASLLENTTLNEQGACEVLEKFKSEDTVLYSENYDCFYFNVQTSDLAGNNSLKCIKGTTSKGKYTVKYTLEFSDTIEDTIEFETSFYEDNGVYKFISNRCIDTEKIEQQIIEFERQNKDVKTVTDENGTIYAYKEASEKDGAEYYINGGKSTAYYRLYYIKTDNIDYYFMDDAYISLNKSEKAKYYYKNCYPGAILTYEFKTLQENFARVIKNT